MVKSSGMTYSAVFADVLGQLARHDERVVAVTAAMPDGTGLASLAREFPNRIFDVGIAEQHATTFCAGLATQGMRPFFAVYSTFLQRAVDQVIHDVCLQNLPVTFCIDRAGIVGDDGETHQGVFDIAYLRAVPNLVIAAPKDENDLSDLLHTALAHDGPMAIRYPRGKGPGVPVQPGGQVLPIGKAEVLRRGDAATVLAYGATVEAAVQAARELDADGLSVTVINMRFVKPIDAELLAEVAASGRPIVTVEEHAVRGGFGSAVVEHLVASGHGEAAAHVRMLGLPDEFVRQGSPADVKGQYGIDAAGIVRAVQQLCRPGLKLAPAVGTARRA
jgi:1-deoxy-D-xylulose-5-phosphate synthase